MLVLTRKTGEGIVIDGDIRLTVIEARDGSVRLGIEAPRDKKVHRNEVYEQILQENKEATQWEMDDLNSLSTALSSSKERK